MPKYEGSTTYKVSTERIYAPTTLLERVIVLSDVLTEILNNNPRRLSWHICNRDVSPIYYGFSTNVSENNGFFLAANGGFASMHVTEDGEAVGYPVYALSVSGAAVVRIMEVVTL